LAREIQLGPADGDSEQLADQLVPANFDSPE
jgi:hypothetical protein